jgi:sortase (surface protein transpeptidase)
MSSGRTTIGLDNPVFQGRLRQPVRQQLFTGARANYQLTHRSPARRPLTISDVAFMTQPKPLPPTAIAQPVYPRPRLQQTMASQTSSSSILPPPPNASRVQQSQQQSHSILKRLLMKLSRHRSSNNPSTKILYKPTKVQFGLIGMAAIVFILGIFSSLQTIKTNHNATAQVAALARKANNPANAAVGTVVPSTTKPSPTTVSNYIVAPNYPKYLKIPALGVDARVLQVGITSTGALGTPPNIYDSAWYSGSAQPGQPGAMLIDGHVSSWTAHGVFYGLKTLQAGDSIQIVRGDGTVFNYRVVKTQIYSANNVDMQAAMTPIAPGTPGLNLISCTGDVIPGTSLFNERIIVFAKQV